MMFPLFEISKFKFKTPGNGVYTMLPCFIMRPLLSLCMTYEIYNMKFLHLSGGEE